MKKLLFILFALIGFTAFAQRNIGPKEIPANKPIEITKGKFFVDGEQYSGYDIKNHLKNNNLEAYNLYKKSKTKSSLGGFALGLGCGLIAGDAVKALVSDEDYPGPFTYVGAGFVAVSIPILVGRTKKMEQSLEAYNSTLSKEKTLGFNFDVNIITNQNGIGFNVTF